MTSSGDEKVLRFVLPVGKWAATKPLTSASLKTGFPNQAEANLQSSVERPTLLAPGGEGGEGDGETRQQPEEYLG